MTFEQFYTGIRTRWQLILAMVLLTVATTVGHSLTHGKIYFAHAMVLVDMHAINPLTTQTNALLQTEQQQQMYFINKIFLAVNEEVARRMAAMDPTISSPEFISYWERETGGQGDIVAWYAKILMDSVLIGIPKNTTIIDLGAYGETPERAANLANAYAKSYIEVSNSIKLKETQSHIEALQITENKIKKELDATWKEFLAARASGGITSLPELYSDQNIRTMQTNVQISQNKAEQIGAKNRVSEFNRNPLGTPNLTSLNFAINDLATDISREQAQLEKYKAILGPQHPSVKEGEARLLELQGRLRAETSIVQRQEQQAYDVYQGAEEQLLKQLNANKIKSAQENELRNKLTGLSQKIVSLTLNYSDLYQAERINTTSSLIPDSNLTLLSPATPPTTSALPNWPVIIFFAAMVGLVIGMGTAMLLERIDNRIHTPTVIQQKLNIPTIGIIQGHVAG